jgi:hypothetical protein
MNIHYKNYPTDYIDALQSQGKRHKARCFWEYYNDVQNREVNSIGFYAKSWGSDKPMSKGSVHKWVIEFRDEIQKFYDAHSLVNQQHYSSVKKQSERQVNGKRTEKRQQTQATPSFEKNMRTASERQVNKALNIYDNNNAHAMFQSFYFIYRQFNKYAGNRNDAYESYKNIDDVSFKSLDVAAILYLKDQSVEKKVGAKRFIDDKIYLNYIDMKIEVLIEDTWTSGVYDTEKEVFVSDGGEEYSFKASRFAEKLSECEVRFIREVA